MIHTPQQRRSPSGHWARLDAVRTFTPQQQLVFLDRYALKHAAYQVGDRVFVSNRTSPFYGKLGKALAMDADRVTVRLDDGQEVQVPKSHVVGIDEENVAQMWDRVAQAIAQVEPQEQRKEWTRRFREALDDFQFVPGGRILAGAGTGDAVTFYNCYVIPSPEDSRRGILDSVATMVEIMSRGGGVGINLSSLRPAGAHVRGVNGTSSGPVVWGTVFSTATGAVEQGGSRQGALMLMLHDWHPDVLTFMTYKRDHPGQIDHANLSVCVSDDFMRAVKEDADWDLVFPDTQDPHYAESWHGDLQEWQAMGGRVEVYQTIRARTLWHKLAEAAHASGEPGVVFLERYNKMSNTWYFQKIISVNPCGEQGLPAWGVCNLGAVNLARFVDVEHQTMDWERLERVTKVATRFLDDVIDATVYFFPENERSQREARRVGLGTMGLADTLILLEKRYGSPESLELIDEIYRRMRDWSYEASIELAEEKGAFPKFEAEKYLQSGFAQTLPQEIRERISRVGIRNATLLTQAPTGTTSIVAGASSGIEPVFRFVYKRHDRTGEHIVYHALAQQWMEAYPDQPLPDFFTSADQLTPEEHTRVQAAIQHYVDSSISKTVNAPHEATIEDTLRVYQLAYDLGCKGITYFRDGSVAGVLSEVEKPQTSGPQVSVEKPKADQGPRPRMGRPIAPRPQRMVGRSYVVPTHFGNMTLDVHEWPAGDPFEVIVSVGAAGSDLMADAVALGMSISLLLRLDSPVPRKQRLELVIDKLRNIGGAGSYGYGAQRITSLASAVAKGLETYLQETADGQIDLDELLARRNDGRGGSGWGEGADNAAGPGGFPSNVKPDEPEMVDLCPNCGAYAFVKAEGCQTCLVCGHSKC